jgi:hypothetical protein
MVGNVRGHLLENVTAAAAVTAAGLLVVLAEMNSTNFAAVARIHALLACMPNEMTASLVDSCDTLRSTPLISRLACSAAELQQSAAVEIQQVLSSAISWVPTGTSAANAIACWC